MPDAHSTLTPPHAHEQTNAEVLLWQGKVRAGFAALAGAVGLILHVTGTVTRSPRVSLFTLLGYLVINLWLSRVARRRGAARDWMVAVTMASDVLFMLAIAYLLIPPQHYDRVLLGGFAILHLTEFYFGRRLSWMVLGGLVAGYLGLVSNAIANGAVLSWTSELGTAAVFTVAAATFIVHYSNFNWRLNEIVSLFDRAEGGDFSGEYDAAADKRPDSVTLVGRAYNRVRPQLANLVMTDALSGCQNRRGLEQQLAREVSRAARTGRELALIAIDIDHFKTINDTFGHLGGDEFMLLLPETNAAGAFRLATRMREEVSKRKFQGISGKVPVTVSIGLVA